MLNSTERLPKIEKYYYETGIDARNLKSLVPSQIGNMKRKK